MREVEVGSWGFVKKEGSWREAKFDAAWSLTLGHHRQLLCLWLVHTPQRQRLRQDKRIEILLVHYYIVDPDSRRWVKQAKIHANTDRLHSKGTSEPPRLTPHWSLFLDHPGVRFGTLPLSMTPSPEHLYMLV